MRNAVGAELSRPSRACAPVGCVHQLTPDWPAQAKRGRRRSGAMFTAAAIGFAGAAFGSPPAALAQSAPPVPPAALTQSAPAGPVAALAQSAPASTPTPVAAPSAAPMNDADKRIAADLLFKRLLAQTRRSRRRIPIRPARDRTRRLRGRDRRARAHPLLQPESSPGEAPTRRALFSSAFL